MLTCYDTLIPTFSAQETPFREVYAARLERESAAGPPLPVVELSYKNLSYTIQLKQEVSHIKGRKVADSCGEWSIRIHVIASRRGLRRAMSCSGSVRQLIRVQATVSCQQLILLHTCCRLASVSSPPLHSSHLLALLSSPLLPSSPLLS